MRRRIVFGLDLDEHLRNVKDAVKNFLVIHTERPASFSALDKYMDERFRSVDKEMFKEWVQKEFPNDFDLDN